MRGGCLLAVDWLRNRTLTRPVLFWQPVLSGAQHLQHFLRMRLATGYLGKGGDKESLAGLRERLAKEGALEIVGYRFSRGLAGGLEQADLAGLPAPTRVLWLEIGASEEPSLSPASAACLERLRSAGCDVRATAVAGSAFWQIVEREEAPALLRETLVLVERWS
jgi:exosortase A-associated hydrolase 2